LLPSFLSPFLPWPGMDTFTRTTREAPVARHGVKTRVPKTSCHQSKWFPATSTHSTVVPIFNPYCSEPSADNRRPKQRASKSNTVDHTGHR
jgi:hypothetical protein